ncbi:adenosylcobinamide amidohydrolase [Paenibacillus sp. TAB 01]|uniref:adenosylcobinamide amidohydrolase n=1 Tax=Paenibacillus sp. TAB 01 TaxID=3368988 RepID=UPI003753E52B
MNPSLPEGCSIPGVSFQLVEAAQNSYYQITSERCLRTLNSSMWGGGLSTHRILMNRQVDKSYMCEDPLTEMHEFMKEKGIPAGHTAAMLTAARVQDFGFSEHGSDFGLTVCAWATVGLSNKARAGRELRQDQLYPGTINIIVLVDGELTDAAMVNAVITATEAKAAALQDLGITLGTVPDASATGTTTDAVLIAATQRGPAFRYAGTSTELGYRIGRTVYASVVASTKAYLRWQSRIR